jgi:hypothetical protein
MRDCVCYSTGFSQMLELIYLYVSYIQYIKLRYNKSSCFFDRHTGTNRNTSDSAICSSRF